MYRCFMSLFLVFSLFNFAFSQEKLPIPDGVAILESQKTVSDLFKTEYLEAKLPSQKFVLANNIVDYGNNSNDAVSKYVLYITAKKIVVEATLDDFTRQLTNQPSVGIDFSLKITELIINTYDVNALELKSELLNSYARVAKYPQDNLLIATHLRDLVTSALERDSFEQAKRINTTALNAARKSRSVDLIKSIMAQAKEVDAFQVEYGKIQSAIQTLETDPDDPHANFLVGSYYCFVNNEWEMGLLMLALGDDDDLKKLAEVELSPTPNPISVGNSWWNYSDKIFEDSKKDAVKDRAIYWYKKATNLQGLDKKLVENRIKEHGGSGDDGSAPTNPATNNNGGNVTIVMPPAAKPTIASLTNTTWQNSNGATFEFTADGKLLHNGKERAWKIIDKNRVEVSFGKGADTLFFNEDFTRFHQTGGGTHNGRKIK